jgi:DNA-binding protein H-NS
MAINLEALSHKELEDLINNAESHIKASRAENIKTVRSKIETLLTTNGLNLVDVFPTRGSKVGSKSVVAPKYQNPSNGAQTWSGRGKRRKLPRLQSKRPLLKKLSRRLPKSKQIKFD